MPDPKPHHRRAAAEALLSETGMKYAQLEHPEHLVRWYEDADSVPLTRVMGYRHEAFARTAQAIADAEERGRPQWQPIATAPRDGAAILVMRNDWAGLPNGIATECTGLNTYVAEWWSDEDEGGRWVCYMDRIDDPVCPIEPTHWMPLPPPPGAALEGKP